MSHTTKAVLVLGVALVAGALVQQKVQAAATELGVSHLELALLGAAAGALVRRAARRRPAPALAPRTV